MNRLCVGALSLEEVIIDRHEAVLGMSCLRSRDTVGAIVPIGTLQALVADADNELDDILAGKT